MGEANVPCETCGGSGKEPITMEEYLQEYAKTVAKPQDDEIRQTFDFSKIAVRFTGKWRSDRSRDAKREEWTGILNQKKITDVDILSNEDEARLGSTHCLGL